MNTDATPGGGCGERGRGLAIAHQIHEGAHRIVLGREVRNPCRLEDRAGALVGADPGREHQCGDRTPLRPAVADALRHRLGNSLGRRNRGFHIRDQHRIAVRIIEQCAERYHVAVGIGIARDVDRIGIGPARRQHLVEPFDGLRRQCRRNAAELGQPVGREDAEPAAIGQDRQSVAARNEAAAKQFGAIEQLTQVVDAQHAGATECGVVDRIGAGQRAGVGRGGLGALRHPSRLDDDDRLQPRRGARRRHELARVLDGFEIDQDRAGVVVEREIIQEVGDVDIELVADRRDAGEAEPPLRRPFDHRRRDRAGLRDQSNVPVGRLMRGEARIELGARHHDAEAIRPDQAHAMPSRRLPRSLRERARAMAKTGRQDRRTGNAGRSRLRDDFGNRRRRCADDDEIRNEWQRLQVGDGRRAINVGIVPIDDADAAGEAARSDVPEHRRAERRRTRAAADDCDASRRK
ncbi:hypothetical protein ACVMDO_008530 [Bradyrhizobium sp. USDA 4513]